MFSRLKGFNLDNFLDSKIAEEEARQKKQPPGSTSASRRTANNASGPATRRPGPRSDSTSAPARSSAAASGKTPDPEEFVIGDDSAEPSRVATPRPTVEGNAEDEKTDGGVKSQSSGPAEKGNEHADEGELPEDVRRKLAKLEIVTGRYQDLLRNYRAAHARVSTIEPFEAALREATPLTSIADPVALTEFLNQRNLQSGMILDELKRITGEHKSVVQERDELKIKLAEAEKQAKEAFDEAAGLPAKSSKHQPDSRKKQDTSADEFFSFEAEQEKSLQEEVAELEANSKSQKERIDELTAENATLKSDLDACQVDLDKARNQVSAKEEEVAKAMREKSELAKTTQGQAKATSVAVENVSQELSDTKDALQKAELAQNDTQSQLDQTKTLLETLRSQLSELQTREKKYQSDLEDTKLALQEKTVLAEQNFQKYTQEQEQNSTQNKTLHRDEKGIDALRGLVNTLREQASKADVGQKEAEGKLVDLRFETKRLEAEIASASAIIARLRHHEAAVDSCKKRTVEAERERDETKKLLETKKGHEAAVASLRSQLKRTENDRDNAYQMILNCGKCEIPEKEAEPTPGDQPQDQSSQNVKDESEHKVPEQPQATAAEAGDEPVTTEAKKKGNKKKKAKNKKKGNEQETATIEDAAAPSNTAKQDSNQSTDPIKVAEGILEKAEANESILKVLKEYMQSAKSEQESRDDERDAVRQHLEHTILDRDNTIAEQARTYAEKEEEIAVLQKQIGEKEAAIITLTQKLKGEDDLRYDLENAQESLLDLGSEITDAKYSAKKAGEDKVKLQEEYDRLQAEHDDNDKTMREAIAEGKELKQRCESLEEEVKTLKDAQSKVSNEEWRSLQTTVAALGEKQTVFTKAKDVADKEIADLQKRKADLEKDLRVANDLAQSRFKDLTNLRESMNKLQPELKQLRADAAELQSLKVEMDKANASIRNLESKEKNLKAEIANHKATINRRESELSSIKEKLRQMEQRSTAVEESFENARKELETSQSNRDTAIESRDRLQAKLRETEQEVRSSKSKWEDLDRQVKTLSAEASHLREDLQIKTAQQASAQSHMESMRDQTQELATQMKEMRERNESLDEELADAHRLLSERSREADTMRRMLSTVENRAEAKVKEMRERMDLAVEERNRAEDEASNIGRRRGREVDDIKVKLKDAERDLAKAVEARQEAERRESEFRSSHLELERRAKQATEEGAEIRMAMTQLRDALDESERQARDLEKQRMELRQTIDEREARLERMSAASKTMAVELRNLKTVQSSRSSMDSSRVTSPGPGRNSNSNFSGGAGSGSGSGKEVDFVYLKNVLLQFLEQRDKKHQLQLVPVLGMLLHFDKQEEQKWTSVISTR